MTPILVSKVRSLRATQEASVPCQVDLRGASGVGNPARCQYTRGEMTAISAGEGEPLGRDGVGQRSQRLADTRWKDGQMDSDEDVQAAKWSHASLEALGNIVGAAAGAAAGMAWIGPVGGVIGAAVPPYILAVLDTFGAKRLATRRENAARVLIGAAEELGTSVNGVLESANTPERERLAEIAVAAGANTDMLEKIAALGKTLARGLRAEDPAVFDEARLILAALADIEAPHLWLLDMFGIARNQGMPESEDGQFTYSAWRFANYSRGEIERAFPQYRIALDGLLTDLLRHGLVAETPVDIKQAFDQFARDAKSPYQSAYVHEARLRLTSLGLTTLRVLREAGSGPDGPDRGRTASGAGAAEPLS